MNRVILHIDMNAYFATCAVLKDPSLKGKPLVVGSKKSRSIVTTASYEARKFGVKSAMPIAEALRLCPHLIIVESDFSLYETYTEAFVNVIKQFSYNIEMASIDECYVDVSEEVVHLSDPISFIVKIQSEILTQTGLSCSIGVASNKFLAKMASDMKKPFGITILRNKEVKKKLWPLPIQSMYGIGKKTAPKLKELNIFTIGDLANYSNDLMLKKVLGKSYLTIKNCANGIDYSLVDTEVHSLKSIGNSTTLQNDTSDYVTICTTLKLLAKKVASRADKSYLIGKKISITLKYADFRSITRSKMLENPSNDFESIYLASLSLLDANFKEGDEIRLLGVSLVDVIDLEYFSKQLSLFDEETNTNPIIKKVVDDINKKIGKEKLTFLSQLSTKINH